MSHEFLELVDRSKKNVSMYSALVAFNLYILVLSLLQTPAYSIARISLNF
jgi:hypothetical protein